MKTYVLGVYQEILYSNRSTRLTCIYCKIIKDIFSNTFVYNSVPLTVYNALMLLLFPKLPYDHKLAPPIPVEGMKGIRGKASLNSRKNGQLFYIRISLSTFT